MIHTTKITQICVTHPNTTNNMQMTSDDTSANANSSDYIQDM